MDNLVYVYTFFDSVAGVHSAPQIYQNDGVAKRTFAQLVSQESKIFLKNDMKLFKIGSYDSQTGTIVPCVPEFILGGESV